MNIQIDDKYLIVLERKCKEQNDKRERNLDGTFKNDPVSVEEFVKNNMESLIENWRLNHREADKLLISSKADELLDAANGDLEKLNTALNAGMYAALNSMSS